MSPFVLSQVLLAAQGGALEEWRAIDDSQQRHMDRLFECYERERKRSLHENLLTATAESTIDDVEKACVSIYDESLASYKGTTLENTGPELVSHMRDRFREEYLKDTEKFLTNPEFAETRVKAASAQVGQCVRDRVVEWADQASAPDILAQAAVNACEFQWKQLAGTMRYKLKADKVTIRASEVVEEIKKNTVETATVWVFEERAKK